MGGFGSTRWNGIPTRQQADSSLMLCAPSVRSAPGVMESTRGVYIWPRYGYAARYELCRDDGAAVMTLRHTGGAQIVYLEATPANLGGSRWWWLCPDCGRRCGKLYLPPRRSLFKCRECYNLSYESAQASRASYYELFKSSARCFRFDGPQAAYLRGCIGPVTATYFRERIRAGLGGAYLVADLIAHARPLDNRNTALYAGADKGVE